MEQNEAGCGWGVDDVRQNFIDWGRDSGKFYRLIDLPFTDELRLDLGLNELGLITHWISCLPQTGP